MREAPLGEWVQVKRKEKTGSGRPTKTLIVNGKSRIKPLPYMPVRNDWWTLAVPAPRSISYIEVYESDLEGWRPL